MEIKEINTNEYDILAKQLNQQHYLHSYNWSKFRETAGWNFKLVGFYQQNKLIAAANLRFKKLPKVNYYFCYIPRGFIIDYTNHKLLQEITLALKNYLKKEKAFMFKIDPDIKRHTIDANKNIIESEENNYELINFFQQIGYIHQGYYDYNQGIQPRYTFRNYLKNKIREEIFQELRSSYKTKVKQARRKGIKIIKGNIDDLDSFMELMESTGEKLSQKSEALIRDKEYFQTMYKFYDDNTLDLYFAYVDSNLYLKNAKLKDQEVAEELKEVQKNLKNTELTPKKVKKLENKEKELLRLFEATKLDIKQGEEFVKNYPQGIYLSGAIFVKEGDKVWYLYGARNYKYNKIKVTEYLFNEVMNIYAQEGFQFFDLYGVGGDISKDSPTYSLYDFKKGFGGEYLEFIGEFDYVINKPLYKIYRFLTQKNSHEQKGIKSIINKILIRK